ncbi:MAG: hypothetical protein ACP5RK_00800 [Candidatus Micrarchaeia archaeon]
MLAELTMFFAVALFTLGSAFLIYVSKSIMRSAISLALTFFGASLALLFANQSILALLQLLILVGGLSTYMIIAFSFEKGSKRNASLAYFSVLAIVVTLSFILMLLPIGESGTPVHNGFLMSFESLEESSPYILYIIAFLPFAGAIGSILLIKRLVGKIL